MTYKQGDRVEFTEDYMTGINKGDKATVINVYESHAADVKLDKGGNTIYVWQSRFKKLEEPKFKKGDKVAVDLDMAYSSWHKCEGTVVDDSFKNNPVRVRMDKVGPHGKHFTVGEIYRLVNLTKIEAKEEGFKVGDKVKVVRYNKETEGRPVGLTGEVTAAKDGAGYIKVKIDTLNWLLAEGEIELFTEPKPFSFGDIQKGDTIRRTFKMQDGTLMIREGAVSTIGTDNAVTRIGTTLAFAYDTKDEQVTLELVNRPEPDPEPVKEPELWENRKAGDQILAFRNGNLDRIFTKQEDGLWGTLLNKKGTLGKGFVRSDKDLGTFINGLTEKRTLQLIES